MIAGGGANLPGSPVVPAEHDRASRRRSEARAYAQLLVSEVRLYHEEAVIQGRHAHDLARRVDEPLAAARARYARRFPEAAEREHFQAAVLRVLAGGDPARLGQRG